MIISPLVSRQSRDLVAVQPAQLTTYRAAKSPVRVWTTTSPADFRNPMTPAPVFNSAPRAVASSAYFPATWRSR